MLGLAMEEDKKINMALDDIIMLEKKKENNKSNMGITPIGSWKRFTSTNQNAVTDPNRIQNLRYTHTGPLARRNYKRYGTLQRIPQYSNFKKGAPVSQYLRNKVRYATQFLNRTRPAQSQRPFSNLFVQNRLLALKRLQQMRALRLSQMASRTCVNSDNFSVVIPNELAMKQHGHHRGRRSTSQLTVRNMEKFNALAGNNVRSRNGSVYSAGYRSRRSRSASMGRNSRSRTPVGNRAGSINGWNSRPGTPANSEMSGYSVRTRHSRLLNYDVQRKIAMLQGKAVPVDLRGRPVVVCNGLGLDFLTRPVASAKTLHERIATMLQSL